MKFFNLSTVFFIVISISLGSCTDCEEDVVHKVPFFITNESSMDEQNATAKMLDFIYFNLNYPELAVENLIEGRTAVQFNINTDGKVANPVVIEDLGFGCDEEAIRLVNLLSFVPAENECMEVIESTMTVFIKFEL